MSKLVPIVLEVERRGDTRILAADAHRLVVGDACLLAVARGTDHLPRRNALGPDGMQQGNASPQRRLPITAGQWDHDCPHDAATVLVVWPVDATDDPFLPRMKLEGTARGAALRMTESAQKTNRALAVPQRVRDNSIVEEPTRCR